MKIPNELIIKDGVLLMADGSSSVKYLKKWQKNNKTKNGTFINILEHEHLKDIDLRASLSWMG